MQDKYADDAQLKQEIIDFWAKGVYREQSDNVYPPGYWDDDFDTKAYLQSLKA